MSNLGVADGTYTLTASTSVTNLTVSNSTVTINGSVANLDMELGSVVNTVPGSSVTTSISVYDGSTLNLGANLNTSGIITIGGGSTFNMNGYTVDPTQVLLGWTAPYVPVIIENQGTIIAGGLYLGNQITYNLLPTDSVGYLAVSSGSDVSTAATSNVSGSVDLFNGASLTLVRNLNLSGYLNIQDASYVEAQNFAITANQILVGWNGMYYADLVNTGLVQTNDLYMGHGSSLTLHGGDIVNSQIMLTQNSILTVQQTNGIGLTFNGTSANSLSIDLSQMDLVFTLNTGWDFRWLDPSGGGNWIGTLDTMISDGQIVISSPDGYSLVDQGGYTYIMAGMSAAVPEPSSLVLLSVGAAGSLLGMSLRRRKR